MIAFRFGHSRIKRQCKKVTRNKHNGTRFFCRRPLLSLPPAGISVPDGSSGVRFQGRLIFPVQFLTCGMDAFEIDKLMTKTGAADF